MELSNIILPLLTWYQKYARILPWRQESTPYRVWISEIMLQQTRVEAVKPYFERFMQELPDIEALAKVEDDKLLKLWEGLGYYSRARNLKKAAQMVIEEYDGALPANYDALLKLPGIGEYTAGAIASIAFHLPVSAVDGNVLRVISRVMALYGDITDPKVKKDMREKLNEIIPPKNPGDFNQALMELGATVCLPNGLPDCLHCPLQKLCSAYQQDLIMELPVKAPKKSRRIELKTICVLTYQNQVGIRKREQNGLLSGLWEFLSFDGTLTEKQTADTLKTMAAQIQSMKELGAFKHIFTHVEWHMTGFIVELKKPLDGFIWVNKKALENEYALPSAFRGYTSKLLDYLK